MAIASRIDSSGAAFKGSQKQIQLYVNSHTLELNCAVATALGAHLRGETGWKSPLHNNGFAEFHDSAFLKALELQHLKADLQEFWPSGGPRWDALARTLEGQVLLVEAKSYPAEMRGSGCAAQEPSRAKIERRLHETAQKLGLATAPASWMGDLYQSANRLAHLHFLRDHGVEAFLINVCFVRDQGHVCVELEEWRGTLREAKIDLAVGALPFVADAFLPALALDELHQELSSAGLL